MPFLKASERGCELRIARTVTCSGFGCFTRQQARMACFSAQAAYGKGRFDIQTVGGHRDCRDGSATLQAKRHGRSSDLLTASYSNAFRQ
jgi:hypothetical protein